MSKKKFKLNAPWSPAGDQPAAIAALASGAKSGMRHQTLLGVTGSGKTFTVANVIDKLQMPTLVIAHNKTLAAQLAQEYREFFPDNAVHYFVSYYDYYVPEAYIPQTDTYIEKDADINEEIDRLRHASTQALLTRRDVIVVASVSCIYGLGSPEEYQKVNIQLKCGMRITRRELMLRLIGIYFERTTADLAPGKFRAIGNVVEIVSASEKVIFRIEFTGDAIANIQRIDFINRKILEEVNTLSIFPAKHFVTPEDIKNRALFTISEELKAQLIKFKKEGKLLESERIKRRTNYDIAMIGEVGYVKGIENYSRHLSGRKVGEPPDTLLSYFPYKDDGTPDFLTVIDESHVTVPQLTGMYAGDASRKRTLIAHGFRLPSALDNRPLKFLEFDERVGQLIYTSATPGPYELEQSRKAAGQLRRRGVGVPTSDDSVGAGGASGIVEQIIRPTGLIDPELIVRPIIENKKAGFAGQVNDLIGEIEKTTGVGERSIATTLTKKMAEDLSEYLSEAGVKSRYIHSEVKTLDRIKILTDFRRGVFDCLVGVNLLREGLDLPEVSFIGILDADKEGFLRSETSLIQTIGRAARNIRGRVVLYADSMTGSMERAIGETARRRKIQLAYNTKHKITPKTISKKIHDITEQIGHTHEQAVGALVAIDKLKLAKNPKAVIAEKERQMNSAVKILDFETAAILRDEIKALRELAKGT